MMVPTEFTPVASLIGGVMIGIAAVMLMALDGRVAGISGILGRLLPPYEDADAADAAAFLLGLIAAPLVYALFAGGPFAQTVSDNAVLMGGAGLLVGFGAALGGGCTSGHGVCGLSRLSVRSMIATAVFMFTGFATMFVMRHVIGGYEMMRLLANLAAGLIFGLGLLISGMANPAKVQNFLDLAGSFDPSLIFVMAGAVVVTFIGYRLVSRRTKPVLGEVFRIPTRSDIDAGLIAGAALFGIGWALSGYCPGPAITSIPLLAQGTLIFVPAMIAGIGLARLLTRTRASSAASPRKA